MFQRFFLLAGNDENVSKVFLLAGNAENVSTFFSSSKVAGSQ